MADLAHAGYATIKSKYPKHIPLHPRLTPYPGGAPPSPTLNPFESGWSEKIWGKFFFLLFDYKLFFTKDQNSKSEKKIPNFVGPSCGSAAEVENGVVLRLL